MKNWLRKKIINFLGLNRCIAVALRNESDIRKIMKLMDVSVDYHGHKGDHSWAVICLPGKKMEYVAFVELSPGEIMDVSRFLKNFRRHGVNPTIDRMPNMPKEFFY